MVVAQPIEGAEAKFNEIALERARYDAYGNLLNDEPVLTFDYTRSRNSVLLRFVPEAISRVIIRYAESGT